MDDRERVSRRRDTVIEPSDQVKTYFSGVKKGTDVYEVEDLYDNNKGV